MLAREVVKIVSESINIVYYLVVVSVERLISKTQVIVFIGIDDVCEWKSWTVMTLDRTYLRDGC